MSDQFPINNERVQQTVRVILSSLNDAARANGQNYGEVLLALGQAIGSIIVEMADTADEAKQMTRAVTDHMLRTMIVGQSARGKTLVDTSPQEESRIIVPRQ